MKSIRKFCYDKESVWVREYSFDNVNGIVDIGKTVSILLQNGIEIQYITVNEYGDVYEDTFSKVYYSVEEFAANAKEYSNLLIDWCFVKGKKDEYVVNCSIEPLTNSIRIIHSKSAKLSDEIENDAFSDRIAEQVNRNLRR